jgi:hypothetical protein
MHSNSWKSGDTLRYQQGIINLFGQEKLNEINLLVYISFIRLRIDDYKDAIPKARSIVKWLKLQDREFTKEERLFYRDKFNKEIGIYKN